MRRKERKRPRPKLLRRSPLALVRVTALAFALLLIRSRVLVFARVCVRAFVCVSACLCPGV
eukprot:11485887-Alexandrium_andersonii.AAC.1